MSETLEQQLDEWFPRMIEWRRHLHRNPELSYRETETSRMVAEVLRKLGLETETGIGGHGVTGLIDSGKPGPTIALRADMDALPIRDGKSCDYASQVDGVMHACGHDAHTSVLLAAAGILKERKEHWSGKIKLIFQPAEEMSPGGAQPMIRDGVLTGVDAIYGIHLWTPYPAGSISTRPGPFMAAADEFTITIKGKGGHGGLPHETVDSLVVGAHLAVNLQAIVSRNLDPTEPGVVSIGSIQAGTSFNVIADLCTLNGTVRTFNVEVRDYIRQRLKEITRHTCAMFGAEGEVEYKLGYPPVINHERETQRVWKAAEAHADGEVFTSPLIMAAEDFAYYLQKVPGCFLFVGAGNPEKGIVHPHHHPKFDIDESCMRTAARLFVRLAEGYTDLPVRQPGE
ncbi:M20 family metallopeptidase [Paenibacillus aurantius]|uniref:M20 family metallopeptidase n=1 Tax=Paenibacillus aurantius TaxID=2918900 RepID=A0AA96RHK7_9BACL|nr:M20 family metallopeptidase [Paenibacillus aurantius]WNQ13646.1 M20 family metallopeptidase [Paenibacillus aurantius]